MTTAYDLSRVLIAIDACKTSRLFVSRFDAVTPVMIIFHALPWDRRGWLWDLTHSLTLNLVGRTHSPLMEDVSAWLADLNIYAAELHRDIVMPDFEPHATVEQILAETARRKIDYFNSIDRVWKQRKEAFWLTHGAAIEALIEVHRG